MKFPRQTIAIGDCIAVIVAGNKPDRGKPFLSAEIYPHLTWEGERWSAHRLSYHLNCEEIPRWSDSKTEGLILHTCDHKWCIRPEHLYKGSTGQNQRDYWATDRSKKRRDAISRLFKGKPKSEETKRRMSEGAKRRWKKS